MIDFDAKNVRELFSRLFVLAVMNKINFDSFSNMLEKSFFVNILEKKEYNEYFNNSIEKIFYDITGFKVLKDESYGVYNDAYWCGQNYYDLHTKINKSYSYIFLKLPFSQMINLYPVYHEMDFSSLVDFFNKKEKDKTILRLLCENKKCSLNDISKKTLLSFNTLLKYNASDDALYNGSFQNISKIVKFFDVPYDLFVK